MNPPPGPADEIEMQMKEKEGQSRFVLLQDPGDEFAVRLFVAKQDFYGFDPRPVDLFLADGFVAVAEVQTNESNELSEIVLGSGLSQIRNGHRSLPLIHREHFATETITDAHAGAKFPYFVHGFHSRKMADSLRMLLRDVGNLGVFPGNPTGSSRKDFSLAGCPRIWLRKPMGLGG
jgi:hypothetical protein